MPQRATLQWFCDQMNADRLIVRGQVGEAVGDATVQLWTQHRDDEPIWGGVEYRYRQRSSSIHFTIFPGMKEQLDCALEAQKDWGRFRNWSRADETVVTFSTGIPQPASSPLVLSHLSRLHGLLEGVSATVHGPEEKSLSYSLSHRLGGMIESCLRKWKDIV